MTSRAPPQPQVERQTESTASLVGVGSPHIQSVRSNFENQPAKTTIQAERLQRDADEQIAKEQAGIKGESKKEKVKATGRSVLRNADNPVFIGNAFLISAVSTGLGFAAYRKHAEGKLSWKVVGLWTGAVGLFAAADYFVSKWFLQNKYPKK
ncbi:hypothetical protein VTN77DRAFT_762 [Rasamsonia byssochlamydoides]|uniref:uncharacterized protein n=1 Tax=Rasamsonia byssochlamydoides TaxID=89139 RepID=UPI0037420C1A